MAGLGPWTVESTSFCSKGRSAGTDTDTDSDRGWRSGLRIESSPLSFAISFSLDVCGASGSPSSSLLVLSAGAWVVPEVSLSVSVPLAAVRTSAYPSPWSSCLRGRQN